MTHKLGTRVRVTIRNGRILEGVLLDAWRLGYGGWSVTLDCGEGRRHYTTLEPIVAVHEGFDAAEDPGKARESA